MHSLSAESFFFLFLPRFVSHDLACFRFLAKVFGASVASHLYRGEVFVESAVRKGEKSYESDNHALLSMFVK
jgi:hypothetical protein